MSECLFVVLCFVWSLDGDGIREGRVWRWRCLKGDEVSNELLIFSASGLRSRDSADGKWNSDFTLRSPSSWEELGCYRGKNKEVARYFCPRCGVNVVGRGRYSMPEAPDEATSSRGERSEAAGDEERGGMVQLEGGGGEWMKLTEDDETGDDEVVNGVKASMVDFFALNLVTLDQPQEGLDLSVFRIQYWDGRRDLWMNGCKQVPWPGGIV